MSARDDILAGIRARRVSNAPRPPLYRAPTRSGDLATQFAAQAAAVHAEITVLEHASDIPQAIANILRSKNLPAIVHVPDGSALGGLPWEHAPGLTVERAAPGPDDAALAEADFGIAETGTLAYFAKAGAPASWHFRPGLEIAVVHAETIMPHMENALAQAGVLPHTVNFVSGPSRTGDIEQTLELGAHGPKALAILIVKSAPASVGSG
ncbi:MAG TPA: LUD domain-containing protein [Rhizomicrobium sp.]|nr:LUD domain-containing protein [Rhizomicrobium sp.]